MWAEHGVVEIHILATQIIICMVMTVSRVGTMHVYAETETGGISKIDTVSDSNEVTSNPDNGENDALQFMSLSDNMADDVATDLATLSNGATLSSGVYYLSESKTFGNASTMNNGLKIESGATVYIYIPNGITLTAIGGGTNTARTTG